MFTFPAAHIRGFFAAPALREKPANGASNYRISPAIVVCRRGNMILEICCKNTTKVATGGRPHFAMQQRDVYIAT
jgi:hypothetical protein